MDIDIKRILDIDYLKELVSQKSDEIRILNGGFNEQFDLKMLKDKRNEEIKSLFTIYEVNPENVIAFLSITSFDEWEFSDLYEEDRDEVRTIEIAAENKALVDIEELNEKIELVNEEIRRSILELETNLDFIRIILKVLDNNGYVLEDDVNNLEILIKNSDLDDKDKTFITREIVSYLIDKKIGIEKIVEKKEEHDEELTIDEFEVELSEVYASSSYIVKEHDIDLSNCIYGENILEYYNKYKELFAFCGLGDTLNEVLVMCSDLANGLNEMGNSITKEEFCVRLGNCFNILYQDKQEIEFESDVTLKMMDELDKFYNENLELSKYKKVLLEDIENSLEIVYLTNIDGLFIERISNDLALLYDELNDNFFNVNRKEEIVLELVSLRSKVRELSEVELSLDKLLVFEDEINEMLSTGYKLDDDFYNGLSELQSKVNDIIMSIKENGLGIENSYNIKNISDDVEKYRIILQGNGIEVEKKKVDLKGFVLFDLDRNYQPYVISDLDKKNKKMIDDSIESKDLVSGFKDYSKLIDDLLKYGKPSIMRNGVPVFVGKILDKVYYDPESREHPTGMVRVRPIRNTVARFIEQRIILNSGTEIHNQVCGIVNEVLPLTNINKNEDFVIYINYASGMKRKDEGTYDIAINRFDKATVLRRIFMNGKTSLSDDECKMLREIVVKSVDAYFALEDINPDIKFDFIREGGAKTRG